MGLLWFLLLLYVVLHRPRRTIVMPPVNVHVGDYSSFVEAPRKSYVLDASQRPRIEPYLIRRE